MERKDVIKMDTVIKVKCIDQALTLINSPVIASGGLNENKLECEFCEKWDGFSKTAVFYQDKKNVYYSVLDENDTCVIPKEATASKGTMFFGIFGSNGDVTRTSEILRYKIDEGAITEDLKPSDPTPDIYEQILAKLQEIREAEATFETNITNQQNTFESKITEQQNNYEASITGQQSAFETAQTKRQEDYETNLNGQMTTFRSETEAEITEKLSKVYRPCGSVANYDALPKNAEVGDVYNLLDTGVNYAWTGTEWDSLAGIVDLSDYYTKSEADTLINKKVENIGSKDLLWENSEIFCEAQTIKLDLTKYDMFCIEANTVYLGNRCVFIFTKGENLVNSVWGAEAFYSSNRLVTITDDGLTFGEGRYVYWLSSMGWQFTTNRQAAMILKVYGIKNGATAVS